MRIVHIEGGRHLYGGPRQLGYLIEGLAARGAENFLLCPPALPPDLAAGIGQRMPVPMHGDLDPLLALRLARRIGALAPDIVHVHSRRGADLWGGIAARLAGVPAVLTRRVVSTEPRGLLRLKCRPYAAVVAISSAVDAELDRAGVAVRRQRIASAVDAVRFRPRPEAALRLRDRLGLAPGTPLAAVVAQLIPRKGHADLIAALAQLPARHRNLVVACFGQGSGRAALKRDIAAAGLDGRVMLAGYWADLDTYLPGADLLIHPARREGLGVAVLEAMSAGVAVLVTAAGGIVDAIRDGVDGRLVPPGEPATLAHALAGLLDDPAARRRFGAAARERALAAFSVESMTRSYLDLYREIVGNADVLVRS